MASAFSHVICTAGISAFFFRLNIPAKVWGLGAVLSILPDLDVIGFGFGIAYGDPLGHRGITHSIVFAVICSTAAILLWYKNGVKGMGAPALWLFFFFAAVSHGVLDALTDGGLGVAFFAPFDNQRYFFPFLPVRVSPIGIHAFFSQWGLQVILSELVWIGLPSFLLGALALFVRHTGNPFRNQTKEPPDGTLS